MRANFKAPQLAALLVAVALALSACTSSTPPERPEPTPSASNPNAEPSTAVTPTKPPTPNDTRPNVVLMLVDDMRVEDLQYMPQLRKLLTKQGVYFPNMISPNPVCCPARASLITAQYTHNNGVLTNKGPFGGMQALKTPANTLPVWLQQAGYNTAFFGKYLNGYGDASEQPVPLGWDWWDATGRGTYAFTHFQFANNGSPEEFKHDYITTRLRQRSDATIRDFAREREETGEPFFVFDSYVAPHGAIGASPAMKERFPHGPIPEKKYWSKYKGEVNPTFLKPSYNKVVRGYPVEGPMGRLKPRTVTDMQKFFLARIQSLASVDDAVAQTVKTLKKTGQYENTVLMFLSDNGYLQGEHQKSGKQYAFAESLQVPLIIAGPGFPKGQVSARWATTVDAAATILSLAKAKAGLPVDGVTLEGASNRDPAPTTGLLVENGNNGAKSTQDVPFNYQGLLLGLDYTYVAWETSGGKEELYDNERDPYQLVNVAEDPRYSPVLSAARKELARVRACSGPGTCETARAVWPEPLKPREVKGARESQAGKR